MPLPAFSVHVHPSPAYKTAVTVLHVLTLVLLLSYFSGLILVILLFFLLLSFIYGSYYRNPQAEQIHTISIAPDFTVTLSSESRTYQQAVLQEAVLTNRLVMILVWRVLSPAKTVIRQTVWADMCTRKQFHQLFLIVNWCLPKGQADKIL